MKSNIKLSTLIIISALSLASLRGHAQVKMAADQNVVIDLNEGRGSLKAVLTPSGKFRISEIKDDSKRKFSLRGDLIAGETAEGFAKDCKKIYAFDARALRDLPDSLKLYGVLFPYSTEALQSLVGGVLENRIEVTGIEAAIALGPNSLSAKAFNTSDLRSFTRYLNSRLNVDLAKVKNGQEVELDFTGLGPLVCDVLTGDAQLKFMVRISHEAAVQSVFSPISDDQLSTLSKSLLVNYMWDNSKDQNLILGSALTVVELQKLGITKLSLNTSDLRKDTLSAATYVQLISEIFDVSTGKPKFLEGKDLRDVTDRLTVKSYELLTQTLSVEPQLLGVK